MIVFSSTSTFGRTGSPLQYIQIDCFRVCVADWFEVIITAAALQLLVGRQGAGIEILEDHREDDTRHTGGKRDYKTPTTTVHQRAHATAQPSDRDGGTFNGQAPRRHRFPRSHGGHRDVKIMTWEDPDFDLPKIQSVLHHLYLDGLSRN